MASPQAVYLDQLIDKYCRNYGPEFFHNMNGNTILHLLVQLADAGGSGGGSGNPETPLVVTSANFINATDCPIVGFNGLNLSIYMAGINKFITQADSEWTPLVGGGFKITIPGFNSTSATFTFYVFTSP
jgi:hypothetical protein